MSRTMVVTGVSSGFGLVIAAEALAQGWRVLGSVRREPDGEALRKLGGDIGLLDICDEASCAAFAEQVNAWCEGSLDCVVHNAGTAYPAPMIGAERQDFRQQFEVNTIGHIDFNARLVEPMMNAGGISIFISSVSTQMPTALLGAYAASKRALEAMAESLAMEVAPLGLRVAVVRPGSYRTAIWETSVKRGAKYLEMGSNLPSRVQEHYQRLGKKVRRAAVDQPMAEPAQLGRFVLQVAAGKRRGFYHTTPLFAKTQQFFAWLLPTRVFHRLIRWVLGRS
jgi:NAD(P)-dependent dehydrogenase (short-subunit alcohol dehydrogenase family)